MVKAVDSPDREIIEEWLARLHGNSPGHFALTALGDGRIKSTKWYTAQPASLKRAARTICEYAGKYDLYISVASHTKPAEGRSRGSTKTVHCLPGLWADLDVGTEGHKEANLPNPPNADEALRIIEGLPTPTAIINSGGGLQVWWLFDQPWVFDDPGTAVKVADAWSRTLVSKGEALGYHVDGIGDIARILRVPGTFNHKTGTPRPVTLRDSTDTFHMRETLGSLGTYLDMERHSQQIDDNFPLSWEQILSPHGYTLGGTDAGSGGTLVARPGKSLKAGHSGVIDPYGVPVYVNYSASDPKLPSGSGQRLTKLKVYAALNFNGDLTAAERDLRHLVDETDELIAAKAALFASSRIDWSELWAMEDEDVQWLIEPLVERGSQTCIFSEAKAGKSLLSFHCAVALATGGEFAGQQCPLSTVVYVDLENTRMNLRERGIKMGVRDNPLERLHYYSFPTLAHLDSEEGGYQLYAIAKYHKADIVILDTLSRLVAGEENSSDTYHKFYTNTGVRLKREGIALLRLDHAGKDVVKGMRGSSSKTTDVDDIWLLKETSKDVLHLERTHTRMAHGESEMLLERHDEPTRHESLFAEPAELPTTTEAVSAYLDQAGVNTDLGVRAAWEMVRDDPARPKAYGQTLIHETQKARRMLADAQA